MATLKKIKFSGEKQLHEIIEKELDALEEGMNLLKYEYSLPGGTPDFLCADSGGRLVIIEVKVGKDENVLFQALRYYNEIDKQRYAIAQTFSEQQVEPSEHPRILLIAENFSDDMKRLSTLVLPDVELFEYTILETPEGAHGICYHPVILPKIEEAPPKQKTIEELRDYMTEDALKPLYDKLRDKIKKIGKGIKDYPTQDYVAFKFRNRQIGWLRTQRKSFDLGVVIVDDDARVLEYKSKRIEDVKESNADIFQDFERTYKVIRMYYQ